MARVPVVKMAQKLNIRQQGCCMSKRVSALNGKTEPEGSKGKQLEDLAYWMPHARTGIYCPKGREKVIDDVPNGAASPGQSYWLRSTEGVDKPDL